MPSHLVALLLLLLLLLLGLYSFDRRKHRWYLLKKKISLFLPFFWFSNAIKEC